MGERKVAPVDTWPLVRLVLLPLPWTWRFDPRRWFWRDAGCTSSFIVRVLFLEVEWGANRPMFTEERSRG